MNKLLPADLLLINTDSKPFSKLIAQSTHLEKCHNYSHIAIVEQTNPTLILHATKKNGCIEQSLENFFSNQSSSVDVYRAKIPLKNPQLIIKRARKQLGQPYNPSFIANQPGFYCSEYVIMAFAKEHLFLETPINFGPNQTVLPEWNEYYKNLGLPVPNQQLGSSPNSIVASQQLKLIYPNLKMD